MNSSRSSGRMILSTDADASEDFFDFERLWTIVRRNLFLVGCCVFIALVLAVLYLRAAPPTFASRANIFLDDSIGSVASELPTVGGSMQLDNQIASQVQVLRSNRLASFVVDELDLTQDPSFLSPPPSPIRPLLAPLRYVVSLLRGARGPEAAAVAEGSPVLSEEATLAQQEAALRETAILVVQNGLSVTRVDRSSVISLSYVSHDPDLAYRIVRAYTDAFLIEQRRALADASLQATGWMETRLAELATQQRQASLAVENFRSRNNLQVARGEFVSQQRLSDLTGQTALAESEVAAAQARSEQVRSVLDAADQSGVAVAALAASSIEDEVFREMQSRFVEMSGRITQISSDFGADHPQAVQLVRERDLLSAQLVGELNRLASRYDTEYAVAQNRLAALEGAVTAQTDRSAGAGEAVVQLRELEQEAETFNTLYASFLARYEEAVQRQSFPLTNFRVISDPLRAERPIGPRFLRTLAVFGFLGGLVGVGVAGLREFNERGYRTGSAISRDLGIRFLGYLSAFPRQQGRVQFLPERWMKGVGPLGSGDPNRSRTGALRKVVPGAVARGPLRRMFDRLRRRRSDWAGSRGDASGYALKPSDVAETISIETLRNAVHVLTNRVGGHRRARVVGIVSTLPGEGKTTVAVGLARLMALSGYRVGLLDGDLRQPAVRNFIPPLGEDQGLAAAIRSGIWRNQIFRDEAGVDVLATVDDSDAKVASVLLGSKAMGTLVEEMAAEYDFIVIDLPPAGLVVDAKTIAPLTDAFLLVVRWGETARVILRTFLAEEPEISTRVAGVVLNGTQIGKLRKFGERGSREHVFQRYGAYYRGV